MKTPIYNALTFLNETISNNSEWWVNQLAKYPNKTTTSIAKALLLEQIHFMQSIVDNKEMAVSIRKNVSKQLTKAKRLLRKL